MMVRPHGSPCLHSHASSASVRSVAQAAQHGVQAEARNNDCGQSVVLGLRQVLALDAQHHAGSNY